MIKVRPDIEETMWVKYRLAQLDVEDALDFIVGARGFLEYHPDGRGTWAALGMSPGSDQVFMVLNPIDHESGVWELRAAFPFDEDATREAGVPKFDDEQKLLIDAYRSGLDSSFDRIEGCPTSLLVELGSEVLRFPVPREDLRELTKAARAEGRPVSHLVRELLESGLASRTAALMAMPIHWDRP
jgi:hypothetical protein